VIAAKLPAAAEGVASVPTEAFKELVAAAFVGSVEDVRATSNDCELVLVVFIVALEFDAVHTDVAKVEDLVCNSD